MSNYLFINDHFFYLLLLPIAFTIWYFVNNKKNNTEVIFTDLESVKNIKTLKNRLVHIPTIFYVIAICLLIFALARPQSTINWEESTTEGIDIVLSMDI